MQVVFRRYRGAPRLMEALEEGRSDVERLLRDVRGFVAYYLVRSGDGGMSITVCEDRIGTEEATRLAADWITANAPAAAGNMPEIVEGEAVIQVHRTMP